MSNADLSEPVGWCLRFLSGAVRGRSIALATGDNLLGSGADCQVLLPASDALARHLEFTVGAVALSVRRVGEASARINGQPLGSTRRSLVTGDVVSLGSIDFQIERSYPGGTAAANAEHADSMFLDAEGLAAASVAAAQSAPPTRHRRALAVGVSVWGLVMALAWWGFAGHAAPGHAAGDAVDLRRLEGALKDYPETEVLAGTGGRMSVRGFVESQGRRAALQQALQAFGDQVSVHVHAADELVAQARGFVSDPGLAISYAGRGRLVVSGQTESPDAQERIQRLAADLHPTVLVSDQVKYRPKPVESPAEPRDQWAAWQRALPSRMVSITEDGAGMRYIQLANGNVYFEGSVLKSGVELNGLSPQGPAEPNVQGSTP